MAWLLIIGIVLLFFKKVRWFGVALILFWLMLIVITVAYASLLADVRGY